MSKFKDGKFYLYDFAYDDNLEEKHSILFRHAKESGEKPYAYITLMFLERPENDPPENPCYYFFSNLKDIQEICQILEGSAFNFKNAASKGFKWSPSVET